MRVTLELGDCTVTIEAVDKSTAEAVFSAVYEALVPSASVLDVDELNERLGIADMLAD